MTTDRLDTITDLADAGWGVCAIARELHIQPASVLRFLHRHGCRSLAAQVSRGDQAFIAPIPTSTRKVAS